MKKDFLSITDLNKDEIFELLDSAIEIKKELKEKGNNKPVLQNKTLIMIFEKPSLRTRLSFEIGMTQFGGHAIYLGPSDIGLGKRESVSDIAKVASSMGDIIMARTFAHSSVVELGESSSVPVINALSDLEHPCQILADFMTILEVKDKLEGLTLAFVGDGNNNVTNSLLLGSALLGMNFRCASPEGYGLTNEILNQAKSINSQNEFMQTTNKDEAVKDADVVITDTWISMGSEGEKEARIKIFAPYQVDQSLMRKAKPDAIFMHCLPAYRESEVTAEVIDGKQSVVFPEAENRLHAQKALILKLLKIS